MAVLVLGDLEFAVDRGSVVGSEQRQRAAHVPLIEPHGILYKKERLLGQERRAQGGGEVEMVQEHSDHLRVVHSQSQSQLHPGHDAACGIALMRSLRPFIDVGQCL
jgi:hypothetical protein